VTTNASWELPEEIPLSRQGPDHERVHFVLSAGTHYIRRKGEGSYASIRINGSLTIQKGSGTTLTYSLTSSMIINETRGATRTLAPGDCAVVVALATSSTVATSITYTAHK
jgi:hypothetical protein